MPATNPQFQSAPSRPGYLKVRLYFHTWVPKHLRSHMLKEEFHGAAPYQEDVCVLMPLEEITTDLNNYTPIFQMLLEKGIVASGTRTQPQLRSIELLEEDEQTLAYYLERL